MGIEDLQRDLKEAMKARDRVRVDALRMAIAAVTEKHFELKRELTEGDFFGVLRNQIRRRQESIEQFEKAGRADLVEKESKEAAILEAYLPQALSEEDLDRAIDEIIRETGAASKKDVGKVMKAVMARFAGRVDGKVVNQRVLARLS